MDENKKPWVFDPAKFSKYTVERSEPAIHSVAAYDLNNVTNIFIDRDVHVEQIVIDTDEKKVLVYIQE